MEVCDPEAKTPAGPATETHMPFVFLMTLVARSGGLKCLTASESSRKELAELKTQHARREELRANEQPWTRSACFREISGLGLPFGVISRRKVDRCRAWDPDCRT